MDMKLATYIAAYIQEELDRNPDELVTPEMILEAVEAYEGGAR